MSTDTDSTEIIKLTQGHIAILIGRNWDAINELLSENEEVALSAKIVITERTPEAGEHSDVDHRVKTTISFSKKVSDSTESALEDPSNAPLRCPHDRTLDEYCPECSTGVFVPQPEVVDPERFPETGDTARETREAKAVIEHAAQPIGTSVGAKLDQAAVKTKAPQFVLDLAKDDWTVVSLMKKVRIASKAAGWDATQISALADILKKTTGVNGMVETLRPFVIAEEPDTHIIVQVTPTEEARLPLIDLDLPTGIPLNQITTAFRDIAAGHEWSDEAINAVVNEAERQARVIGDEPEATEQATKYLRSFCVSK